MTRPGRHRHWTIWLAACLLPALLFPAPALAQQPPQSAAADANPLVLEVTMDGHVLSDSVGGFQRGEEVFLPLGELARLLTIAVRADPERGTATGYVLQESRSFSLDLAAARVTIGGAASGFPAHLARVEEGDIYVSSRLLGEWLPAEFAIDMSTLTLTVKPRERLPLQERLERETRGGRAVVRGQQQDPGYPLHREPYRKFRTPTVDQTLGIGVQRGGGLSNTDAMYTAYATGELLGMESTLYYSAAKGRDDTDVRFTIGRRDPDAGLLGPMRARAVLAGNVPLAGINNIALSNPVGDGFLVSNRPLSQPTGFDTHTLEGDLPPGWDVELFFNDALVGFQQAGPSGRYAFVDQPLVYGPNEFRLVFHGPLGQVRVERQSFLLDRSSVAPGDFLYTVAASRDDFGEENAQAQFEWGISKSFSATGGLVNVDLAGERHQYANLGVRAFGGPFIIGADVVRERDGGHLAELYGKTRIGALSLSASRAWLDGFTSDYYLPTDDKVRTRDRLRADGAVTLGALRLPLTLDITRDMRSSGMRQLDVLGRIAAYRAGTAISNTVRWHSFGEFSTADGELQVSRRIAGIGLLGNLQYALKPEVKGTALTVAADKALASGYVWNLGITRAFEGDTCYFAGLSKGLGRFGLSANVAYSSSRRLALGLQLFIAAGREPREGRFFTDAQPMAAMGAASMRLFLDKNLNGIADADEEGIPNAAFIVNGAAQQDRTGPNGMAYLPRLPAHQHVDIGVDVSTLEDPQWTPRMAGVRTVPRPGVTSVIDIPVILTGEIDGTTYLVEDGQQRAIGDIELELLDNAGKVAGRSTSASDGYYIVPAVPPGEYRLRISREQLARLKLEDTGTRLISMGKDGQVISGVDLYVIRAD